MFYSHEICNAIVAMSEFAHQYFIAVYEIEILDDPFWNLSCGNCLQHAETDARG